MADPEKPVTFQSADGRFSVSLLGNVVEKMVRFCSAAHDLETGGILIGRYSDNRAVAIVEQVTGPPPDSHHYFRDSFEAWLDYKSCLTGYGGKRKRNIISENGIIILYPFRPQVTMTLPK